MRNQRIISEILSWIPTALVIVIVAILMIFNTSCEDTLKEVVPTKSIDKPIMEVQYEPILADTLNKEPMAFCNYMVIKPKVYLQAPFDTTLMLMHDSLRVFGWIPELWNHPQAFNVTGPNAIVDAIIIQISSDSTFSNTQSSYVTGTYAFLQRDGDIRNWDGSPLEYNLQSGWYWIRIKYGNHIDIMSPNKLYLYNGMNNNVNFTTQQSWGNNGQVEVKQGVFAMWGGDANGDEKVIYSGPSNDPQDIYNYILFYSALPNYISHDLHDVDVTMDGYIIYSGLSNDPTFIYNNVRSHPSNIGQLPNFIIQNPLP